MQQSLRRPKSSFEFLLNQKRNSYAGLLSSIYRILIDMVSKNPTSYQKQWKFNDAVVLEDERLSQILSSFPFRSSIFSIQWQTVKTVMRWYYMPKKLNTIDTKMNPKCVKGCDVLADYLHNWWHCPVIKSFWSQILIEIKKILMWTFPVPSLVFCLIFGTLGG